MSSAVQLPHDPISGRSQATAIEQSRAVAEVYAAVLVAQNHPRNSAHAISQITDACKQMALAERAFYRFNRGEGMVTGASVQLARELARCWGNITYGVSELRRDDVAGESEMLAFAWDIESNARPSHTFIVKHRRDTKKGVKELVDQRDIYENNANNAARRLREQIFAVLPVWFVEQGKALCRKTIEDGGGVALPQRIATAIEKFAEIRVTQVQLEAKLGLAARAWTAHDVAALVVIFQSINAGETTKDEEFPAAESVVTVGELGSAAAQKPAARRSRGKPAEPPPAEVDEEELRRQEQLEMEAEIAAEEAGKQA